MPEAFDGAWAPARRRCWSHCRRLLAGSESLATLGSPRLANLDVWIARETPLDRSRDAVGGRWPGAGGVQPAHHGRTVRKYVVPAEAAGLAPSGLSLARAAWAKLVRGMFPELVDARCPVAGGEHPHDRLARQASRIMKPLAVAHFPVGLRWNRRLTFTLYQGSREVLIGGGAHRPTGPAYP